MWLLGGRDTASVLHLSPCLRSVAHQSHTSEEARCWCTSGNQVQEFAAPRSVSLIRIVVKPNLSKRDSVHKAVRRASLARTRLSRGALTYWVDYEEYWKGVCGFAAGQVAAVIRAPSRPSAYFVVCRLQQLEDKRGEGSWQGGIRINAFMCGTCCFDNNSIVTRILAVALPCHLLRVPPFMQFHISVGHNKVGVPH